MENVKRRKSRRINLERDNRFAGKKKQNNTDGVDAFSEKKSVENKDKLKPDAILKTLRRTVQNLHMKFVRI